MMVTKVRVHSVVAFLVLVLGLTAVFAATFHYSVPGPGAGSLDGTHHISLPVTITNPTITNCSDLLNHIPNATSLSRFDAATNTFVSCSCPGPNCFNITAGRGYQVQVSALSSFNLLGSHGSVPIQLFGPSSGVSLNGSNLVSLPFCGTAANAAQLVTELGGFAPGPVADVRRFNTSSNSYTVYSGGRSINFSLDPGTAYTVRVNANVNWTPASGGTDTDGDGVCNVVDNCSAIPNSSQTDTDGDGFGNACDTCVGPGPADGDGDGICDGVDNCPAVQNSSQTDTDGDGFGDACDTCVGPGGADGDGDGICDAVDCAPLDPDNPRPGEVGPETHAGDKATMTWTPAPLATGYDVLRGQSLPVGTASGSETCFENLPGLSLVDSAVPPPGQMFWYVVRGESSCSPGTYGVASNGTERLSPTCGPPTSTVTFALELRDQPAAQPGGVGVGWNTVTDGVGPSGDLRSVFRQECANSFSSTGVDLDPSAGKEPCAAIAATGYTHSLPIGMMNGEARLSAVDLFVPSRGIPFIWSRTYTSRADFSGPIGHNWDLSYQRRVQALPLTSNVSVVTGFGREDVYISTGGGNFRSPLGFFDTLHKNPDGTYTQTDSSGMTFQYDDLGHLTSMADRAGNSATIARNAFGNVTTITDTQGRLYTVAYTNGTATQKILSITDFSGRQVVYTYDGNGDLIRVRSPIVTGTPNGNDFPNGKTTLYTYSTGFSDSRLNHNLLSVVEPLYNVANNPTLSKPWVTLSYSSSANPIAVDFDHVVSERWGHNQGGPPSNPNVVVGGTGTFAYATGLGGDPDAPVGAAHRAIETDRNGNQRAYYFDINRLLLRRIERTNRTVRPGEGDYITSYSYTYEQLLASLTLPRGNGASFLYDAANPSRRSQGNLLEARLLSNGVAAGVRGTEVDLVTRYTHEPVFNQLRTTTDPRAFSTGVVPLDAGGHLNLSNPMVARYTTTHFFDYQEGSGFQASRGVPVSERIPDGLGDLNAAPDYNEGNLVRTQYPTIQTPGPNMGQTIVSLRASTSHGQPLKLTDPEGHVTALEYYLSSGIPNDASDLEGYLASIRRDSTGFDLQTVYGYDTRGNITSITDPNGRVSLFDVNALNQVVRARSRIVFGATRYQVDTSYDANDNVVRTDTQNIDESGALYAHSPLTDLFEYNILHYRTASVQDKSLNDNSQIGSVREEFSYDANMNRIARKLPLAVNGSVPNNIVTTRFDERDLAYKITTGDNNTNPDDTPPGNAVVMTTNYDENGNHLETLDTIRDAQHATAPTTSFPGSAVGDVTTRTYDGFDRLLTTFDAEGNQRTQSYDFASNVTQTMLQGPVDHVSTVNVRLEQIDATFDELNRVVQTDAKHFDPKTQGPIGDGSRITQYKYDRDGKTIEVTDDRNLKTTTQWDTADRRGRTIDALNNEVEYGYDQNDNVVTVTRRDISTDLGSGTDTFTATSTYDGIDRLVKSVDNVGNVNEIFYDSRSNAVKAVDAVRGTGHPTGAGNIVRREYDAMDRLVLTQRVLTANGKGDTGQTAVITTGQSWDDDSRLTSQADDSSHATTYGYDALNRLTTITYADMTTQTTSFDTDSHLAQWTDQRGTTVAMTYDGLDRLLTRTRTVTGGAIGSTLETFGYDGVSRTTLAQNDDGINPGTLDCLFQYDSLSHRTKDQQGSLAVDSVFDGVGNRTQITYPGQFGGGRRALTLAYDNLNRMRSISDAGGTIATMHYKGMSRLERRTYGLDSSPISKLSVGYDLVPRTIVMDHTTGAGGAIARFEYGHDRGHHRLFERRVHGGNLGDVYRYDSIYRVLRDSQNVDLTGVPAGTEIDPDAYATTANRLEYAFDGVGNRTTSTTVVAGVPTVTTYAQAAGPPLRDAEVNQYTSTQEGALPAATYAHDANGNLISDGSKTYGYDFKNRLTEVRDQSTSSVITQYSYDALDRRAMKVLGVGPTTIHYLFDDIEVVEERDGANAITRQYVWGPELDRLLQEQTAVATYNAHENSVGSISALTDSTGAAVERLEYDPFGNTTVVLGGSTGNRFRFQGAYFDDETGFYFMRARTYAPSLGRFLQRDPIGTWTDHMNLGNGYSFVGNEPVNRRDPLGMQVAPDGPSPATPEQEGWERAQEWAKAERERLEGELKKAQEELENIKPPFDPKPIRDRIKELEEKIKEHREFEEFAGRRLRGEPEPLRPPGPPSFEPLPEWLRQKKEEERRLRELLWEELERCGHGHEHSPHEPGYEDWLEWRRRWEGERSGGKGTTPWPGGRRPWRWPPRIR